MFSFSKFESGQSNIFCKKENHALVSSNYYKEALSEDYEVIVNGEKVPVYTCRISKYPFNTEWPGYQRPIEQTETASFVNLVSDEELKVEVVVKKEYKKLILKPYSRNISYEEDNGKIKFTLSENGQFVLNTDSYHHCLYIFNSKPITPPEKESVTYYFGPGVHMTGRIVLSSNESVYIDKDALVFGCIYAKNAENIHIFGNGLLDDIGEGRIEEKCYEMFTNGNLKFYDCKNVNIEGIMMRNSAIWCVNVFHCFNVMLDGIKVFGQWRYNADGVDIVNSQNVTLRNSFIHSFDDTVTIKGVDLYAKTDNENILTENCVLWCDWGKTCEIGLETTCRRYKNIIFRNCDILRAGDTALGIQNGDCAEVSEVVFENINVDYNCYDTLYQFQKFFDQPYNNHDKVAIPHLIRFTNNPYRDGFTKELDIEGIQSGTIHDVVCRNINVHYDEEIPMVDGKYNVPVTVNNKDNITHYNIQVSNVKINGTYADENNTIVFLNGVKNFTFKKEN